MDPLHAEFWESHVHRDFVEALSVDRVDALRDLLLLAALADDLFTLEERMELAVALHDLPGLEGSIDFETAGAIDHVDALYIQHAEEGDHLLDVLLARMGDDVNLSHALEALIVLMSTNDTDQKESLFARRVGVLMELEDEFVDALLTKYGWTI